MGRTNPYVSKEQEFAFFRFSFDAGMCSSPHQISFSGPCTKHLSRVSYSETIGPDYYINVVLPFVSRFTSNFPLEHQTIIPLFVGRVQQHSRSM